jgi:hypothetical protein
VNHSVRDGIPRRTGPRSESRWAATISSAGRTGLEFACDHSFSTAAAKRRQPSNRSWDCASSAASDSESRAYSIRAKSSRQAARPFSAAQAEHSAPCPSCPAGITGGSAALTSATVSTGLSTAGRPHRGGSLRSDLHRDDHDDTGRENQHQPRPPDGPVWERTIHKWAERRPKEGHTRENHQLKSLFKLISDLYGETVTSPKPEVCKVCSVPLATAKPA